MATGNLLFLLSPLSSAPPATLGAPIDIVVGTSTPVESFPVLVFDPSTVWYADWHGLVMPPHYGGGGITVTFYWSATATTNEIVWSAAFREIADDAEDLNTTAQTYDYNNSSAVTAPSAAGEVVYDTLTFTDGADMDNVGAGDLFSFRIRRFASDAGDDCTGNGEIHAVKITET